MLDEGVENLCYINKWIMNKTDEPIQTDRHSWEKFPASILSAVFRETVNTQERLGE